MRHRRSRLRRVLKWTGLATCVVLLVAWLGAQFGRVMYVAGSTMCVLTKNPRSSRSRGMVHAQLRFPIEVDPVRSGILNTVLVTACIIACCCVFGCGGVSGPVSPGGSHAGGDL